MLARVARGIVSPGPGRGDMKGTVDVSVADLTVRMVGYVYRTRGTYDSIVMARRSIVSQILRETIRARTAEETRNARGMVEDGEVGWCDMAPPSWWGALPRCCDQPWQYHLLYGESMDDMSAAVLCPFRRGYWHLARELHAPEKVREIARATARHIAPVWRKS